MTEGNGRTPLAWLDGKSIVSFIGLIATIAGSYAVTITNNSTQDKTIDRIEARQDAFANRIGASESDIAVLQADMRNISELVFELRRRASLETIE